MAAVGSRARRRRETNRGVKRPEAARREAHREVMQLHAALADPLHCGVAVPQALLILERDPLASAGYFAGDLLRRLMELPPAFWGRQPVLYQRYREVVRAAAGARRRMPVSVRRAFWQDLPAAELSTQVGPA